MTHVSETYNEHGAPVSMFRCVGCAQVFTVCPAVDVEKRGEWVGRLSSGCSTYDEGRDGDKLFDAGSVRRRGDRSQFKVIVSQKEQPK